MPSTKRQVIFSHFTDEETGPCKVTCPGSRSLQGPGDSKPLSSVTTQACLSVLVLQILLTGVPFQGGVQCREIISEASSNF